MRDERSSTENVAAWNVCIDVVDGGWMVFIVVAPFRYNIASLFGLRLCCVDELKAFEFLSLDRFDEKIFASMSIDDTVYGLAVAI